MTPATDRRAQFSYTDRGQEAIASALADFFDNAEIELVYTTNYENFMVMPAHLNGVLVVSFDGYTRGKIHEVAAAAQEWLDRREGGGFSMTTGKASSIALIVPARV